MNPKHISIEDRKKYYREIHKHPAWRRHVRQRNGLLEEKKPMAWIVPKGWQPCRVGERTSSELTLIFDAEDGGPPFRLNYHILTDLPEGARLEAFIAHRVDAAARRVARVVKVRQPQTGD